MLQSLYCLHGLEGIGGWPNLECKWFGSDFFKEAAALRLFSVININN